MRTLILSLFFGAIVLFVFPGTSLAAGIVPCDGVSVGGGEVCQTCHFIELGSNILNWIVGAMATICAVVIAFAGLKMATAGGNSGAVSSAKEMITNTVVGFIILLSAWLIVDTVMRVFVGDEVPNFGPWNNIECVTQPVIVPSQQPSGTATTTATSTPVTAICNDDAALIAQYRGSPVGAEDPALRTMINCYLGDPQIAAATDNSQLFTVDRTAPRCSLTNGNRVCGLSCQHSVNSCHYGRGSGQGARAVDFNARSGFTEVQLYNLIQARRATCGGTLNFETNHTHISMTGC